MKDWNRGLYLEFEVYEKYDYLNGDYYEDGIRRILLVSCYDLDMPGRINLMLQNLQLASGELKNSMLKEILRACFGKYIKIYFPKYTEICQKNGFELNDCKVEENPRVIAITKKYYESVEIHNKLITDSNKA